MTVVDRARWEQVYRAEFPTLYRALAAALLDGDAACDALQEAFLEGLRRPPRDENLRGWLYRVALRKSERRPRERGVGENLHARDELAHALDRIEVGNLLRYLTERQRAVVIARFYLGLQHGEIAAALGIRVGTVSATLSQALSKMRWEAGHGE
jgi:RNA polymerase sigma factor (sigma-70 family)